MARRGATRVVVPDYAGLAAYRDAGGYRLLRQVRDGTPSPDTIVAIMQDAGLKGLGGAGFPAGRKRTVVRSHTGPRPTSVNAGDGARSADRLGDKTGGRSGSPPSPTPQNKNKKNNT